MSRRVSKKVFEWQTDHWSLNTEHGYVYDGWNLIREQITGGTSSTDFYVWGLDLSGTLQGAGGIGGLLSKTNSLTSKTYLYTFDANGNVGQLVDAVDGSIAAHYKYAPFGKLLVASGPEADKNVFRFSTKYYDVEMELYYYGFRYYSPELGRWVTRDPIEEDGGLNLYGFVYNSPIQSYDFWGLSRRPLRLPFRPPFLPNSGPSLLEIQLFNLWASSFESELAKRFIGHYMFGNGKPMKLSEDEMAQCAAFASLHYSEPFKRKLAEAKKLRPKSFQLYRVDGWGGAYANGTLGDFVIYWTGEVKLCDDKWSFNGAMMFKDTWDFNLRTPKGRHWSVQLKVIIGKLLLFGKPFEITSEWTHVYQESEWNEARWLGYPAMSHTAGDEPTKIETTVD